MATIYRANGIQEEVTPENGTDFKLKEVQAIVGGYVEALDLKNNMIMLLNEDGKLDGLPLNEEATKLADLPTEEDWMYHKKQAEAEGIFVIDARLPGPDYIAGDVLVCLDREFR